MVYPLILLSKRNAGRMISGSLLGVARHGGNRRGEIAGSCAGQSGRVRPANLANGELPGGIKGSGKRQSAAAFYG